MNDIQDTISTKLRQLLILELAASTLNNQLNDGPMPRAKDAQNELLLEAAVEAEHMRGEINQLMRQRLNG